MVSEHLGCLSGMGRDLWGLEDLFLGRNRFSGTSGVTLWAGLRSLSGPGCGLWAPGVNLWAGLESLGPVGSLSSPTEVSGTHEVSLCGPGWGLCMGQNMFSVTSGVSLSGQGWVCGFSETSGFTISARMWSLGPMEYLRSLPGPGGGLWDFPLE